MARTRDINGRFGVFVVGLDIPFWYITFGDLNSEVTYFDGLAIGSRVVLLVIPLVYDRPITDP